MRADSFRCVNFLRGFEKGKAEEVRQYKEKGHHRLWEQSGDDPLLFALPCRKVNCKRRRRDSNPRAPEGKRISSAPRYDRFDTSPCNVFIIIGSKF